MKCGSGDDTIDGGRAGDDILEGGDGNDDSRWQRHDIYRFANNWGRDTVSDDTGDMDALDFSAASADLEIDLAAAQVTADLNMLSYSGIEKIIAGAGNDKFYIVGSQSMDIYSGPGDDCFIFSSDGSLMGIIDGESGHDTLDYSASNSGRRIILTGIGLQDGFNGEEIDSISAGFANMEGFIGGQGMDTFQGLDADAEFNIYSDRVEYSSDGRTMIITGVENLLGGNENDQFIFHDQAQLPGDSNSINGQGGSNTLDYSKYSSGRTIILTALVP